MNQAIQKIVDEQELAVEILLRAEQIGQAPMRRDQERYHQALLDDLRGERAKLIFGRIKQDSEAKQRQARQLGQQRMHSLQDLPSGPDDRKIIRDASESINEDINRIKLWLKTEPALIGKTGEDLIIAAVEFFHNQRAK